MAIVLLLFAITPINLYYIAFGEKTVDVTVKLSNTTDNIGKYMVHVTVYGKETLEQSKIVDTSSQTCPDDIDSLCFVYAGTFSFASKSVPVGSKIQACVKEISSGTQNCAYGENTVKNTPESLTIGIPALN